MRSDRLYLVEIVEAAEAIETFIRGVDAERFVRDDLVRSAVLHKLTVIGEAAARVSMPLRARFAEVPWSGIVGFRNIAVHAYFAGHGITHQSSSPRQGWVGTGVLEV